MVDLLKMMENTSTTLVTSSTERPMQINRIKAIENVDIVGS
jgi:hypothetical protein